MPGLPVLAVAVCGIFCLVQGATNVSTSRSTSEMNSEQVRPVALKLKFSGCIQLADGQYADR